MVDIERIIEQQIVRYEGVNAFNRQTNELLKDGWLPFAAAERIRGSNYWHQTLVKLSPKVEPKRTTHELL